ncbi:hypothetical protein GCM10022268_17310 [Sphingomonas cynarae]|uniref:Uncharacterized protein n=1 Tax=Sphingomonas cynarae TaxID=930197 RepID=A0ABP7DT34_9SPHN
MSDTPVMKKAKILREFNDAGTEQRYFAGKEHEFAEGVFENYRVAGLVEEVPTAAPVDGDAGKAGRTKPA